MMAVVTTVAMNCERAILTIFSEGPAKIQSAALTAKEATIKAGAKASKMARSQFIATVVTTAIIAGYYILRTIITGFASTGFGA